MKPENFGVPLWKQLQAASLVVLQVRKGVSGTAAIEQVSVEVRAGVQSIAFHTWRNLGRAEALRNRLVKKCPKGESDALLCVALALIWDVKEAQYDHFTLVNQTVEAAKRTPAIAPQANFLNACLRRFLREREELIEQTNYDLVAVWNHPLWWIEKLQQERPDHWQDILAASNSKPPMVLRVNQLRTTPSVYLKSLQALDVDARVGNGSVIVLNQPLPVQRLPGFSFGHVSVQDSAAQLAAPIMIQALGRSPSHRILDACAAPGGKTGHLLEMQIGGVTALEIDSSRSQRIDENLARLDLKATVIVGDASAPETWWSGEPFDGILLDAPCTASGIVRRHPDVRWLRRDSDVKQLANLQRNLLKTMWRLLKPGGCLLYCTCSIFMDEGSHQVQTFLANNTDATLLPSPGHLMPQNGANHEVLRDNHFDNHDGFFYALFRKQVA